MSIASKTTVGAELASYNTGNHLKLAVISRSRSGISYTQLTAA